MVVAAAAAVAVYERFCFGGEGRWVGAILGVECVFTLTNRKENVRFFCKTKFSNK